MFDFMRILKELVGRRVSLNFSRANNDESRGSYMWLGTILEIKNNDRVLVFQHLPREARRMQIEKSYLNLDATIIWSIDLLSEDYEEEIYVTCPKCKTKFSVTEKNPEDK